MKLEFGSLTDQQPIGRHAIRPLFADILPDAFSDWQCEGVAFEIERTFWEKATILHAEYHRPADRPTPDRFSRQYADTAALALHSAAIAALEAEQVRARVVGRKSQFFGSAWAHYDLARPGSFRVVPPPKRLAILLADYDAMRDMYLSEPSSFNEVVATLTNLEKRINAAAE